MVEYPYLSLHLLDELVAVISPTKRLTQVVLNIVVVILFTLPFFYFALVTSCVIFRTARLSSMVVLVESVERLSPISEASL